MTIAIIYTVCGLLCGALLYMTSAGDITMMAPYHKHTLWMLGIFSIVWPLVALCALGFAAGVALGWLEGLVP